MPCTSACRELSADGGCSLTVCRTAQALSGMSVRQQHKLRQIAAVGRVGTSGRSCARLGLGAKKLCQQALLLYSVYACRILEVSSTAIECSMALSRHTSVTGFSYIYPAQLCVCVAPREQYQRKVCPIRCAFYWCRNQAVVVQASICPVHPPSCRVVQPRSCCRLGR